MPPAGTISSGKGGGWGGGCSSMDTDVNNEDDLEWVKIKFCKQLENKHESSPFSVQDDDLYGRIFSTVGDETLSQMIDNL